MKTKFGLVTANQHERGAALLSTVFLSALLLTAGGILIVTTAFSGTNAVSATSEMQAYYGAEAGGLERNARQRSAR